MRLLGWNKEDLITLFVCVVVCELAGVVGSVFTFPAITTWYAALAKPSFTPPNYVFGPVWLTLYALMGFALFIVWRSKKNLSADDGLLKRGNWRVDWNGVEAADFALAVFGVQLIFNALWSFLFFGLHELLIAFFGILALWGSIAVCIVLFWRISKPAALLLLPYLAWVSIASALNYYIWILN